MPQKVSDLVERCPFAKQVHRKTVSEHIRTDIPAGRLQTGLLERPMKNTGNCSPDLGSRMTNS